MVGASVHGATHGRSSGDRPNRIGGNRPPPPLQRSTSPSDLIGALPDAVVHHIFSYLPLRDIVRTSVLSKRWRSTWTTVADLVFDGRIADRPRSTLGFSSLVDRVLSQYTSTTVKKFHVTRFQADRPEVDRWFCFAAERRVEDLCLWPSICTSPSSYVLPCFLYWLSWLVRLEVAMCSFSLGMTIRWPCLKFLSIKRAELSNDFLERVFRGSPVLESLVLSGCWGMKNIIIKSASVKDLVLDSPAKTVKIRAPHLLSLRILGSLNAFAVVEDVSSLVEVELDFFIRAGVSDNERLCCDSLKKLLENLRGVPTITLGSWCLQALSLLEMEGVSSPLSKCQNLILHGSVDKWELLGITYMLRTSQCLEKLVIHLTEFPILKVQFKLPEESEEQFNFDEEDFLCSRKENFECLGEHLKRVEIIGFQAHSFGYIYLFALIKFLLGDALVLEKLIIEAGMPTRHGNIRRVAANLLKLLGVSKKVLGFRRASKIAEVVLDCPLELAF